MCRLTIFFTQKSHIVSSFTFRLFYSFDISKSTISGKVVENFVSHHSSTVIKLYSNPPYLMQFSSQKQNKFYLIKLDRPLLKYLKKDIIYMVITWLLTKIRHLRCVIYKNTEGRRSSRSK